MKYNLDEILTLVNNPNLLGLILHGSTTLDISNKNSDIDILAISFSGDEEDIIEIVEERKYHIHFENIDYLNTISSRFFNHILKSVLDLNNINGRVLSGEIIWEYKKDILSDILHRQREEFDDVNSVLKLRYQMISFLNDATTNNKYVNSICVCNAIDTLIAIYLIKNKIYFLNSKWYPYYVDKMFPEHMKKNYVYLRFNVVPDLEIFKELMNWVVGNE